MCHQGLSVALVSLSIADWCCQPTKWLAWTGSMKLLTWMHVEIARIKLMHIVSQEKGWNICVFVKVCLIPDAHPACPFFFIYIFFFFLGGGGGGGGGGGWMVKYMYTEYMGYTHQYSWGRNLCIVFCDWHHNAVTFASVLSQWSTH